MIYRLIAIAIVLAFGIEILTVICGWGKTDEEGEGDLDGDGGEGGS